MGSLIIYKLFQLPIWLPKSAEKVSKTDFRNPNGDLSLKMCREVKGTARASVRNVSCLLD